jgi:hypothetical protein
LIQCISDTVDTAIHGDTSYRMYHPPSGYLSIVLSGGFDGYHHHMCTGNEYNA